MDQASESPTESGHADLLAWELDHEEDGLAAALELYALLVLERADPQATPRLAGLCEQLSRAH